MSHPLYSVLSGLRSFSSSSLVSPNPASALVSTLPVMILSIVLVMVPTSQVDTAVAMHLHHTVLGRLLLVLVKPRLVKRQKMDGALASGPALVSLDWVLIFGTTSIHDLRLNTIGNGSESESAGVANAGPHSGRVTRIIITTTAMNRMIEEKAVLDWVRCAPVPDLAGQMYDRLCIICLSLVFMHILVFARIFLI
jgi:hypothetical protein